MRLELRDRLSALVKAKFNAAKTAGSLIFSSTELTVIRAGGVPFQLRYCPALSKKPQWETISPSKVAKNPSTFDPFHDPPADLLIAEIPTSKPSHLLVLNKYPVIPNHFILTTKAYKDQTQLLEEDDLGTAAACLREWEGETDGEPSQPRRKLFAFFNSGKHSGASQPHRHLQFLPVEDMAHGTLEDSWNLLVEDKTLHSENAIPRVPPGFPFLYFHAPLGPEHGSDDIYRIYMRLYRQAVSAVRSYQARHPDEAEDILDESPEGGAAISYNLAMTTTSMMLCPRRREGAMLRTQDGSELGPINLNGTVLAGTLMVKTEEEWDALRSDGSKLDAILEAIGIPPGSVSQNSLVEGKL